jgi:hypothetical protein
VLALHTRSIPTEDNFIHPEGRATHPHPFALPDTDPQVRLLAPPPSALSSAWTEAVDVSRLFKDHMAATGWKVGKGGGGCKVNKPQAGNLSRG